MEGMRLVMNPDFTAVIARSEGVQAFTFRKCEEIKVRAQEIFGRQVKHTHPITYPAYKYSFFIRKVATRKDLVQFIVGNQDPAAVMVEFGALAGGVTPVLAYHPLGRALDGMENR